MDVKKILGETIQKAKAQKAQEESDRQKRNDEDRNKILENVGKDFGGVMRPYMDELKANNGLQGEELRRIISESVKVDSPAVDTAPIVEALTTAFSNFKIPEPRVSVEAPNIPAPIVNLPQTRVDFPTLMNVMLEGIDRKNPIPVLAVDETGKPFYGRDTAGGERGATLISDILDGFGHSVMDVSGGSSAVKISGSLSVAASNSSVNVIDSSGNIVGSASNPFNVAFAPSASQNVNVFDGQASSVTSHINGDFRGLDVNLLGITSPIANGEAATSLRVVVAGDANHSVAITGINSPVDNGDSASALRVTVAGNSAASVNVSSISSPIAQGDSASALRVVLAGNESSSVSVTSITGPIAQGDAASALRVVLAGNESSSVNVLTLNGSTPATGTNETTAGVLRVTQMSDTNSSVNVTTFNGNAPATGLNETTNGVLRVVQMTDSNSSVNITNTTIGVNLIGGGNDSVFTYQARTTNPTAVADGADVRPKADKLGRAISRPIQVRDLIFSSYTTLTNGTETTIAALSAGSFHDLIYLMAANSSSAAQQIDIRAVTGGNITATLFIPAQSTIGFALPVGLPAGDTGNNWTVDNADVTNSTVYITALYSRET